MRNNRALSANFVEFIENKENVHVFKKNPAGEIFHPSCRILLFSYFLYETIKRETHKQPKERVERRIETASFIRASLSS